MKIRYYLSGFDKIKGFPEELVCFLKHDISSTNKLVFIPSDFANKEKINRNTKKLIEFFKKANLNFENVIILNENMTSKEMNDQILTADVIFLLGGDPNAQLDIINKNNLAAAIRSADAVVMGLSAGAMSMSRYSLLLPVNEIYSKMDVRKAMNLSDISIYPHYNSNGEVPEVFDDGEEKTKKSDLLYANKEYGPFYLLSDNSEIREENGQLTFIGKNIIYVSNGNFELITKKTKINK
jgi:peptidase E